MNFKLIVCLSILLTLSGCRDYPRIDPCAVYKDVMVRHCSFNSDSPLCAKVTDTYLQCLDRHTMSDKEERKPTPHE